MLISVILMTLSDSLAANNLVLPSTENILWALGIIACWSISLCALVFGSRSIGGGFWEVHRYVVLSWVISCAAIIPMSAPHCVITAEYLPFFLITVFAHFLNLFGVGAMAALTSEKTSVGIVVPLVNIWQPLSNVAVLVTFGKASNAWECIGIAGAFLSGVMLKIDPGRVGEQALEFVHKASTKYLAIEVRPE